MIAILTSLKIAAIYASMLDGMIFGKVRDLLSWLPENLQKPLFACLTCMGGLWGFMFGYFYYGIIGIDLIMFMLTVIGINFIIDSIVQFFSSQPLR